MNCFMHIWWAYLISCSQVKGENRELVEVTARQLAIEPLEKRNWCVLLKQGVYYHTEDSEVLATVREGWGWKSYIDPEAINLLECMPVPVAVGGTIIEFEVVYVLYWHHALQY